MNTQLDLARGIIAGRVHHAQAELDRRTVRRQAREARRSRRTR
jgi:hypothetical protein